MRRPWRGTIERVWYQQQPTRGRARNDRRARATQNNRGLAFGHVYATVRVRPASYATSARRPEAGDQAGSGGVTEEAAPQRGACDFLIEHGCASITKRQRCRYSGGGAVIERRSGGGRSRRVLLLALLAGLVLSPGTDAGSLSLVPQANYGPYHARFLAGGIGLYRPLSPQAALLGSSAPWSMSGWLRLDRGEDPMLVVAAIGDPASAECRCLIVDSGRLALRTSGGGMIWSQNALARRQWYAFAATFDGREARLYLDGDVVARGAAATTQAPAQLRLAPESADDSAGAHHFGGALADFSLADRALNEAEVRLGAAQRPDFSLIPFQDVGVGWPWQERAWRGLLEPQPAWTLPRSAAAPTAPVVVAPVPEPSLQAIGADTWAVRDWRLAVAAEVAGAPSAVATPGYDDARWYRAVVPGTVLTTLIARGVYPDPDVGLNNLAIPEKLSRQDYWYRTEFRVPAELASGGQTLTFNGVNYAAEVWLNGHRLGELRGAFVRGAFDVTGILRYEGPNALAVRVVPPPHPGLPHEQSVAAGPGDNGGNLAIDGPTFIAAEGWDWIPAIRDRNTGLWQDVELHGHGAVALGDPQVVTHLPLPRTDAADVDIRVSLVNREAQDRVSTLEARIGPVVVRKSLVLHPGTTEVLLSSGDYPALHFIRPRLWWPNGYGDPALYDLDLSVKNGEAVSDRRHVRFGIRELSYELSLFDHDGRLRRVEVDPARGPTRGEQLIDVSHGAIKRTATGWAESLTPAGESSPAVRDIDTTALTPYLAIRVNGVPIAVRGGSWGMDDSRKRSSRERLEPYFRLHREAHLNTIRNWLGQNTEEVFYELADEYGLLVLNDFWASTQDFQVEPQDPALFLDNAADVIRRYRNHPSIAVWFGRNEGVPQPILNEGLAALVATLDATRYYTGSSNQVNLQGSGPYNWHPPADYFTSLAQGFSVEVGTPSLAALETLQAMIPEPDRWPLGDSYAYHDWHFGGNGDTASFMKALDAELGEPHDLADFERKAQLMNYESYRAVFEGFQAGLWTRNSGRLLWMSHPAWPSNTWQIYTSDYDTPAAYYAVARACEPLHAQLNPVDHTLAVVNTTREARRGLTVRARLYALDGRRVGERIVRLDAPANATTVLPAVAVESALAMHGVVLVTVELADRGVPVAPPNLYWIARSPTEQQRLASLSLQVLDVHATRRGADEATVIDIEVRNPGPTVALLARLTLRDARGSRVLPAFFSDNYVSLLPGEVRRITARCPAAGPACTHLAVRGFNVAAREHAILSPQSGNRQPRSRS